MLKFILLLFMASNFVCAMTNELDICLICYVPLANTRLFNHYEKVHSGSRLVYLCNYCDFAHVLYHFTNHLRTQHGIQSIDIGQFERIRIPFLQ